MSQRTYFGTDGIRGQVGQFPITAEFALRLGRAAGTVLAPLAGDGSILIGKDTRRSGYMLESALEAGLSAAGATVRLLGPLPTPAVAYLTRTLGASAGIVISASHNPHSDNGLKFFSAVGEKLDDAVESAIEAELDRDFRTVAPELLGKALRLDDAARRYLDFCRSTVPEGFSLAGLRIVVDAANGANYRVGPQLFAGFGADVVAIGAHPDGLNINAGCGTTHPEALIAAVRAERADLGIAFDGDGDRLMLVAADGRLADGDDLLYLLACDFQDRGRLRGPVVGTVMTNFGIETALTKRGIVFERAAVGDRYVHQALVAGGGVLGGEASGHLLCLDRASTGDALVNALQVLDLLRRDGRTLAERLTEINRYPQKTVNVRVPGGRALVASPAVVAARRAVEEELAGGGRVVLRASGTEPVVRVTIEAAEATVVERLSERLAGAVRAAGTD